MGLLSPILRNGEGGRLTFWCPGCDEAHTIAVGEGPGPRWKWNNDADKPTFTPSILVRGTKLTEKGEAEIKAWKIAGYPPRNGERFDSAPTVCHSFVTAGRIQFLGDCTHSLAGQTVDIPPWPPRLTYEGDNE